MGYMNVSFYHQKNADRVKDLPDETYVQSLYSSEMSIPFSLDDFGLTGGGRKGARSRNIENGTLSGAVATPNSWHTSGSGTLVLTTDYLINLQMVRPEQGDLSSADVAMSLAKSYRRDLKIARNHFLGRTELARLVTKKTYVKANPKAVETLPEACEEGADPGHLVMFNYDCLSDDRNHGRAAIEALTELWQEAGSDLKNGAGFKGSSSALGRCQSMDHWCTLTQDQVAILEYDGMGIKRHWSIDRSRRTPPDQLRDQIESLYPGGVIPIYGAEFILCRELFASQGIEINL